MEVPDLMVEKILTKKGDFFISVKGVGYDEKNRFNINTYYLPSENLEFSSVVYDFYEYVFNSYFDQFKDKKEILEEKVLDYSVKCMDDCLKYLNLAANNFNQEKEKRIMKYENEEITDSFTGEPLDENSKLLIADQETKYSLSEGVWQPLRRIYFVYKVYPIIAMKLTPKIREYIPKFQEKKLNSENSDDWIYKLCDSFTNYLENQIKNDKKIN